MVFVVATCEELAIQLFAGFVHQAFPDDVTVLGGAETKKAKRAVCEAVFLFAFSEGLGRKRTGAKVYKVVAVELCLLGGAVKLTNGVRGMTGLIRKGGFARNGRNCPVFVN